MSTTKERPLTEEERVKLAAEAEKARAEAEKARAEAEKARHDAAKAAAEAERAGIDLDRERLKRARELAADEYYHVYRFTSSVDGSSTRSCMSTLQTWSRVDPGCEITLVLSSPGGSIIDGMALFDFLQGLRQAGHRIVTVAQGYAASMAGILLQAGDWRVMGRESYLLIHEASFGAIGSYGEIEDMVEFVEKIQDRILDIFAARSAAADPRTATRKLSKRQIKRRWHRKDWWLTSDEALAHGFVDEIS